MRGFTMDLLTCSVIMSVLALIYMVITPLLARRYSAKGLYYAWLVIVVGLIIPFRPQFGDAIFQVNVPGQLVPHIIEASNETTATAHIDPVTIESDLLTSTMPSIAWWQTTTVVWLAGVVAFLAYHAVKHYRFIKMAGRWSENITDCQSLSLLKSLKANIGLSHPINLYFCPSVGSPTMIGFANPRILLPKADFTPDELRFILQHELVHYKRKDIWYKHLLLAATAMHWFNPFVYLMAKAISVQCELSCDAEVVRSTDVDTRRNYSETIIGVVRYQSKLKTALSTNFYGGKKSMKIRIFSIMDMSKKKRGLAVICGALLITAGTGFVFAANSTASPPQTIWNTAVNSTENAYDKSMMYEKYEEYGLIYDKVTDELYYNGEPVRYFEDWYPVDEDNNAYVGTDYFNENGTIDVHGVRDLTQIVRYTDGSYDPSGRLTGVKPYSQADFDARDIEKLINPSRAAATAVSNSDYANDSDYYSGGSNFTLSDESRESFKKFAEFGLTYDDDDVFRYQEKTVRWFADLDGGMAFTRVVENDYDKSVDLTAIRDANGNLTGLSSANKEEFDQRTERIEQSRKDWDKFWAKQVNATSVGDGSSGSVSVESGAVSGSRQSGSEAAYSGSDISYATSYNPHYADTTLNDYLAYGVSYDKASNTWMFNDKPVSFLIDPEHQIFANYPEDNTDGNFSETVEKSDGAFLKVIRNSSGSIDKIVEMATDEAVKAISDVFN